MASFFLNKAIKLEKLNVGKIVMYCMFFFWVTRVMELFYATSVGGTFPPMWMNSSKKESAKLFLSYSSSSSYFRERFLPV